MAIYRSLHTLTLLLCATSLCIGQQQAEKVLVKSFNLQGNQVVVLDLNGPVEVKSWGSDVLRVQMTISLPNGTDAMLKSLVEAGRYNLKGIAEKEGMKIGLPGLDREVKVRGTKLEEAFSFMVYAPENVVVKMANEASSDVTPQPDSM